MGKKKNHNKRKQKLLPLEPKSPTSDGRRCNTFPETEKQTSYGESTENKRKDLLNQNSKTNTFKKSGSQGEAHHPLPVTYNTKVKIDQTPVNETKSNFDEVCTQNTSRKDFTLPISTSRTGYGETIENEWDDFFNGPSTTNSVYQTFKPPLLVGDKMKPKVDQAVVKETSIKSVPSFNEVCTQNVSSSSRQDVNSSTLAKDINPLLVKDKMKPKVDQAVVKETLIKSKPSLNKVCTQNVSNSSRKDINYPTLAKNINPLIVRDKMKPKVDQAAVKETFIKSEPSFNKVYTQNASNSSRKDINKPNHSATISTYKATGVSKFSNGSFSNCLEAPISNETRPKVNKPMYLERSRYGTQIDSKDSTESFYGSLNVCAEQYNNFQRIYSSWRKERQETIKKLEKLKSDVHNDQHMFNKTNVVFKDLNVSSRKAKLINSNVRQTSFTSMSIDFLTSLTALATDAASGITSIAQAFNIDSYMATFTEIMEHDKGITKPLYAVRSLCLTQYQNVEEVFRKYHSDSLSSTIANVSDALSLEDLWLDLTGEGKDKTSTIIDCLDKYWRVSLNSEAMDKVCNAVLGYTEKNPAALKACVSAGKVFYDYYDAWSIKPKGTFSGTLSQLANVELLGQEIAELNELRSLAENKNEEQANLESEISDAIYGLLEEMNEIDNNIKECCKKEKFYRHFNQL